MADYLVTFIPDMPSRGPAEVAYAEVMDSGWVCVKWRDSMDSLMYYPPQVVLSVKTPTKEQGALNKVEKSINETADDVAERVKSFLKAMAARREKMKDEEVMPIKSDEEMAAEEAAATATPVEEEPS